MYGGTVLLGVLTRGTAGLQPGDLVLDETQWALFRALLCFGAASLAVAVVLTDVGLLRKRPIGT